MADEIEGAPAGQADPKRERATAVYTSWRNTHLNELPVEIFGRLEAASEHLIAEIVALL